MNLNYTEIIVKIITVIPIMVGLFINWKKTDKSSKIAENNNNALKTMVELIVFEKKFIRKFKREGRSFVNTHKDISIGLNNFLRKNVTELAKLFLMIIESQFTITDDEIREEIKYYYTILTTKFNEECDNLSVYKKIIESELLRFVSLYQDVKDLENGNRMAKFEKLCKNTILNIISEIIKS